LKDFLHRWLVAPSSIATALSSFLISAHGAGMHMARLPIGTAAEALKDLF
jgi:hypothetical protein